MTISTKPTARTQNLELQELTDEILIYDLDRHKAHCLNKTLSMVWRACDGTRDVEALTTKLQAELQTPIAPEVIWLALEQLSKNHLLQAPVSSPKPQEKLSRRDMARRVGAVAMIPAIASLLAPNAARAASCTKKPLNVGCPCSPNGFNPQCKSNTCQAGRCR